MTIANITSITNSSVSLTSKLNEILSGCYITEKNHIDNALYDFRLKMKELGVSQIPKLVAGININQESGGIAFPLKTARNAVADLLNTLNGQNASIKLEMQGYDLSDVVDFCKNFLEIVNKEIKNLPNKYLSDPTEHDEYVCEKFTALLKSKPSKDEILSFLEKYVQGNLTTSGEILNEAEANAVKRRMFNLMKCCDSNTADILKNYESGLLSKLFQKPIYHLGG